MAQPIALNVPLRDPRIELQARLQDAPAQHAEALLEGYEVLQALHDAGRTGLCCAERWDRKTKFWRSPSRALDRHRRSAAFAI